MAAIYQEHFGLNQHPFQITPNTDYFFSGSQRGDLLKVLLHVAAHDEGIATIVAEVGTGKTLLARQMIERLPPGNAVVYLANPCFSRTEIISAIGRDLGLAFAFNSLEEKLALLHHELLRRHGIGERVLLVIDEAHAMPAESLEEVRLLSNLETGRHKLVNIMLFGQPELDKLLAEPHLRQVRDRVIHRFELKPFSRDDAAAYIDHRLRIAGWQGGHVFNARALSLLTKASEGRARRINLLADKALLAAYAGNQKIVGRHHVKAACKEFADLAIPSVAGLGLGSAKTATQQTSGFSWGRSSHWLPYFIMSILMAATMTAATLFFAGYHLELHAPQTAPLHPLSLSSSTQAFAQTSPLLNPTLQTALLTLPASPATEETSPHSPESMPEHLP